MRIRFFNTFDTAAPFFRNLVPYLASRGCRVEVVVSHAMYRKGYDLSAALGDRENIRVVKMTNLGLRPDRGVGKLGVMTLYVLHAAFYSLFGPRADKNVFLTQPPLFSLWGVVLSRLRGQSYTCILQDVYPQFMVELGMMPRDSLLTRLLTRLSAFCLRQAESVIVIGRCMSEVAEKLGISAARIHIIPNWADEALIRDIPHRSNSLRRDEGWTGKFVVMYAGNIGIPQHFNDLLTVAAQLKSEAHLLFVFIGEGSRAAAIKARVQREGLENVVLLPFLHDKYSLAEIMSAGDLHFVSLRNECTGLAVPSKSYGVLAAARPILYQGREDGEVARMIREEGVGEVVQIGDVDGLREAVLKYVNDPDLVRACGARGRRLAESRYGHEASLQRYAAVLLGEPLVVETQASPVGKQVEVGHEDAV